MASILTKLEDALDPRPDSAALAAVCDQIDMFDHCLTHAIQTAVTDPFPRAAFLEAARPPLRQLHAELASRSATRQQAEQLLSHVRQNLNHADMILNHTLDELLNERIR